MLVGTAHSPGDQRRELLENARLYLIVEAEPGRRPVAPLVRAALEGGVDIVQLREKSGDTAMAERAAADLRTLCDEHSALLIVNDSPELALASGADGVHLGQDDMPVDRARAIVGGDLLIGISTHDTEQIATARDATVDYLGVGPVHATPTKPGAAPVGEALLRHAAELAGKPFFAIGGIDAASAPAAVKAGASRLAVVRAIRDADDPRVAARELRAAMALEERVGAAR